VNELERIVHEAGALAREYLVATVVRVEGSSYRRPGARMLVAGDRWLAGCVSGGCLEGDVMLRGAHRCRDGPLVMTYDSTVEDDTAWSLGLGCNGIVDVLLEHVPAGATNDALVFAKACFAAETTGTLVTIIRSSRPGTAVGARLSFGPACELVQPIEDALLRRALEPIAQGPGGVLALDELGVTVLVETIAPSPQLFVLGSGHDVAPIVTLATSVGFRVTVADRAIREPSRLLGARLLSTGGSFERVAELIAAAAEPYVVIMHHQQAADRDGLAMALASRAHYIGVLGPARRTRELGLPLTDPRIRAPIGLDVGAETPEQLALAIVGQLLAVSRQARGGMVHERARSLHAEVAVAVLAAGGSQRLGRPKQLVELDHTPIVQRVAATCLALRAGPVAVVLGSEAPAIATALGDLRVARITNPAWQTGIASSIRAAVEWARRTGAHALVITLADQPLLEVTHLAALRDAWLAGAPIAASRFAGVVGAPAIFDRSAWDELANLTGDQGAGRLLRDREVVAIDWPAGALDVDTDDDVAALLRR